MSDIDWESEIYATTTQEGLREIAKLVQQKITDEVYYSDPGYYDNLLSALDAHKFYLTKKGDH